MLFMNTWQVHPDKRHEVYKVFSEMPAGDDVGDGGANIKLIGRWHDLTAGTGVAIYECDDPQAMALWALNWNESLDVDVVPVVNDEGAKAIGKLKWG